MVYLWHIKRKGAGIMNWRNIKNLVKPDDELVKAFSEQWKATVVNPLLRISVSLRKSIYLSSTK